MGDIAVDLNPVEEESLSSLFCQALDNYYSKFRDIEDDGLPSGSEGTFNELTTLRTTLHRIAFCVERLNLFSANEELDDINTGDLPYLLIPFLLAELASHGTIVENRLESLGFALVYWRQFLETADRLQLLTSNDRQQLERFRENYVLDPTTQRKEKIEAYQRSKELSSKIKYYVEKKKKTCENSSLWQKTGTFDEEEDRNLFLALLERSVIDSLSHEQMARKEIEFLKMRPSQKSPTASIKRPDVHDASRKPFVLTIKDPSDLRKAYLERVFQPYHELPSISLAEVAAWEMEVEVNQLGSKNKEKELMKKYKQDAEKRGAELPYDKNVDSDNSDNNDDNNEAMAKTRAFDDWKDEHPKGSGNKNWNRG